MNPRDAGKLSPESAEETQVRAKPETIMDAYTTNVTLGNFQDALSRLVDEARDAGLSSPVIRETLRARLNAEPKSEEEFWGGAAGLADALEGTRTDARGDLVGDFIHANRDSRGGMPADAFRRKTLVRLLQALQPIPF
jgi:hypothetical protein